MKFAHKEKKEATYNKNNKLKNNIDKVSRLYNPQFQYASVTAQNREAFPPLRIRNNNNRPPPWSQSQPQWTPAPSATTRGLQQDWIDQLRQEISSLSNIIKEMSININLNIANNTRKIDFIFGYLHLNDD